MSMQRGALACMEFTGNIVGYASSVVSFLVEVVIVYVENFSSGQIISVLSLILTSLGAFPSFFNV